MTKYWVAINEMADKALILRKNISIEKAWLENHTTEDYIKKAEETIAAYEQRYQEFMEDYNKHINNYYILIDNLYKSYISNKKSFRKAIKE